MRAWLDENGIEDPELRQEFFFFMGRAELARLKYVEWMRKLKRRA